MNPFDKLAELNAQLSQIYLNIAKQYELNLNELHFLYHIGRYGQSSPSEIGKKWSLPKQTVTSVCKRLDKRGFLQFSTDEQDKRGKQIRLSPAGQHFTEPMIRHITDIELQTANAFGLERFDDLLQSTESLLRLLVQHFNAGENPFDNLKSL